MVTAGPGLSLDGTQLGIADGALGASMLGQSGCSDGQLLKWNDAAKAWSCSADVGTVVTAGPGLSFNGAALGVQDGALTGSMLAPGSVTADRLAQSSCSDGQVLKWSSATNGWGCATDLGRDYTAGDGLALSGSTFAIAPAGVSNAMLAPLAVTPDKLGGSCSAGQILKMTADGWACGTDLVGTTGSGGLAQVSVTSPVSGDGTSANPIGLTDGGIATAKLANGAVTAAKLDGLMRTVQVTASVDANFNGSVAVKIDGAAVPVAPISPAGALVLVVFDSSGAPTVETYNVFSPAVATTVEDRLNGLAAGTSVLVAGVGRNWVVPLSNWLQELGALGFPEAARMPAIISSPALERVWIGAVVTGNSRESVERLGPAGLGTSVGLSGWVVGGRFVAAPSRPASLSDADGNTDLSVAGPVLEVAGKDTLQFGDGITKEANAGKIGYETFTADALDVVGAGTSGTNRKIKLWAEGGTSATGDLSVAGNLAVGGSLTLGGPIAQPAWINVVFLPAFANMGGAYSPTQFFRDTEGIVHLRGFVALSRGLGNTLFTLPPGYRPQYQEVHEGPASCAGFATEGAPVRFDIKTTGEVTLDAINPAACAWISLDGVTFRQGN